MSQAYVRALFDRYAEHFDEDLTIRLKYQAPQVLRAMVDQLPGIAPGGMDVLDVGCGTGLAGVAFRSLASRLHGSDLAPRMVDKARRRGVYDHLEVAELVEGIARSQPLGISWLLPTCWSMSGTLSRSCARRLWDFAPAACFAPPSNNMQVMASPLVPPADTLTAPPIFAVSPRKLGWTWSFWRRRCPGGRRGNPCRDSRSRPGGRDQGSQMIRISGSFSPSTCQCALRCPASSKVSASQFRARI